MFITKDIIRLGHIWTFYRRKNIPLRQIRQRKDNCYFRKIPVFFFIRRYGGKVSRENVNKKIAQATRVSKNKEISRPPPPAVAYVLPNDWIIHEMLPFLTSFTVVQKKCVSTKEWWPPVYRLVRSSILKHAWKTNRCIRQSDTANLYIRSLFPAKPSSKKKEKVELEQRRGE